jgi:hypothetical protein
MAELRLNKLLWLGGHLHNLRCSLSEIKDRCNIIRKFFQTILSRAGNCLPGFLGTLVPRHDWLDSYQQPMSI